MAQNSDAWLLDIQSHGRKEAERPKGVDAFERRTGEESQNIRRRVTGLLEEVGAGVMGWTLINEVRIFYFHGTNN